MMQSAARTFARRAVAARAVASVVPSFAAAASSTSILRTFSKPSSSNSALMSSSRGYASATSATSSSFDPQEKTAQEALDEGNGLLEMGDLEGAAEAYKKSLAVKDSAIVHYNLGVVQYQLADLAGAIASFESSIKLTPPGLVPEVEDTLIPQKLTPAHLILADTYTNLGACLILMKPPRPDKALEALQMALRINADDGEVCYNLGAVLEATGEEEEALIAYQRAEKLGIERAAVNVRNIGAKLLGKRLQDEKDGKPAPKA